MCPETGNYLLRDMENVTIRIVERVYENLEEDRIL